MLTRNGVEHFLAVHTDIEIPRDRYNPYIPPNGRSAIMWAGGMAMPFDDDDEREHMPDPEIPRVTTDILTVEQIAMVKLLGGEPSTAERVYSSYLRTASDRADGTMPRFRHFEEQRACPVVEWFGVRRMIRPNGDMTSLIHQ